MTTKNSYDKELQEMEQQEKKNRPEFIEEIEPESFGPESDLKKIYYEQIKPELESGLESFIDVATDFQDAILQSAFINIGQKFLITKIENGEVIILYEAEKHRKVFKTMTANYFKMIDEEIGGDKE